MRDKSLVAAFEAGKALPKPRQLGRLPTDELRVSLVNYCATTVEDHEDEITTILLAGGLNEAGRAAFCSATRKDCRGDAVAFPHKPSVAPALALAAPAAPAAADFQHVMLRLQVHGAGEGGVFFGLRVLDLVQLGAGPLLAATVLASGEELGPRWLDVSARECLSGNFGGRVPPRSR